MGIFTRESRWDIMRDSLAAAVAAGGTKRLAKFSIGLVGGLVTATAASAAVSSLRQREQS